MKKLLVLLIILLAAIVILKPNTRQRLMTWLSPTGEVGQQRSAERALRAIADEVQHTADATGAYPQPGRLSDWLTRRGRGGEDPWGSAYYLELSPDSFFVRSPGPDTRLHTGDDLQLARRRVSSNQGVVNIDYQPAPPPSSAKRTATSKAIEASKRH